MSSRPEPLVTHDDNSRVISVAAVRDSGRTVICTWLLRHATPRSATPCRASATIRSTASRADSGRSGDACLSAAVIIPVMTSAQAFSSEMIVDPEAALIADGIGNGTAGTNRYGLVGFGGSTVNGTNHLEGHAHPLGSNGELWGTSVEYVLASQTLITLGAREDGYDGIDYALDNYGYRSDAAKFIILVADEDRDTVDQTLTYNTVFTDLANEGVVLEGTLSTRLVDGTGTQALAVDSEGTAYLADGSGGYTTSTGGCLVSVKRDRATQPADQIEIEPVICAHDDVVQSVAFSPAGDRIVSGSADRTLRVWDSESGRQLVTLCGHEDAVQSVTYTPDGERIISVSRDRTVRVWNARSGAKTSVLRGHEDSVSSVASFPVGHRIVTGSADSTVRTWDVRCGPVVIVLRGHEAAVQCVAFSTSGNHIVSGDDDKIVRVWDAWSGATAFVLKGHEAAVRSVAFSASGEMIISGSDDTTARIWDARKGKMLGVLRGHDKPIVGVAFLPSGDRVVSESLDRSVRVWDARSCELLTVMRRYTNTLHDAPLLIASESYDDWGWWFDDGPTNYGVCVWDGQSGRILRSMRGHDQPISAVDLSSDGERVASASSDMTIRIWDAENSGQHAVQPDEKRAVSGVVDQRRTRKEVLTQESLSRLYAV